MHVRPYFNQVRQTLTLAFPMIVGQLGGMALGIVDAAMVGRGLGTRELAALTLAINYSHVPFVSAFGLVSAISVHIAQAHGEGKPERVPEILRHGLLLVLGYAVLMVLALRAAFPHLDLVGNLGQPAEILPLAAEYLPWFLASLVTTSPTPASASPGRRATGPGCRSGCSAARCCSTVSSTGC